MKELCTAIVSEQEMTMLVQEPNHLVAAKQERLYQKEPKLDIENPAKPP
jgi:hypothetical protein